MSAALRNKIEQPGEAQLIHTERGVGYRMHAPAETRQDSAGRARLEKLAGRRGVRSAPAGLLYGVLVTIIMMVTVSIIYLRTVTVFYRNMERQVAISMGSSGALRG